MIFVWVVFAHGCGGGGGGGGSNTNPPTSDLFDPKMPGGDMTLERALAIEVEDRRPVFLSNLGPPDTFSKSADEVEGKIIVTEEWSYIEMGVRLDIVDGEIAFVVPIETTAEDAALYPRFYDPMEFELPMDKTTVMQILAGQDLTELDLTEAGIDGSLMVLGDQIMLGFAGDQLVYVETYARTSDPQRALDEFFIDEEEGEVIVVTPAADPVDTETIVQPSATDGSKGSQQASLVESFLPPQARLVIGFFRLFRAHDRRNRIYREASHVQRDYSEYIDRLKRKARELASACNLSTLDRQSNIATLVRLIARLEMERQTVIALTEAEKKTARSRFIRNARLEIIRAIRTSGFGTRVLAKIQESAKIDETLTEIEDLVDGVLDPGGFQQKITERLDKLGILGQVIGGPIGENLRMRIIEAQRAIPGVADLQDAAAEIKVKVIEVRTAIEAVEDALREDTSILSPTQLIGAIDGLSDTLSDPAFDALATALAREMGPGFARNLAVSKGTLDPQEFSTMRERVRGEILQNRSEWLRQRARGECGRPSGASFRSVVDGSPASLATVYAAAEGDSEGHYGPDGSPLPVCNTIPISLSGPITDIFATLNAGDYIDPNDIAVCRTQNDEDGDGSDSVASGGDDCDDADEDRFPGNAEVCDEKDNNCDGQADEGLSVDGDGDGYYASSSCGSPAGDCNDNDATIYPGADEVENDGIDQDCDGQDAVPEYQRYYVYRRSGIGYRKKWGGYAEKRTGYDFFYLHVLPSELSDAVAAYTDFNAKTASACASTSPPLCPCTTYPDIWASGSIELVEAFDTYEEMNPYRCDTYQFDPGNIICTQWEVDTDPKYWDNINGICGN